MSMKVPKSSFLQAPSAEPSKGVGDKIIRSLMAPFKFAVHNIRVAFRGSTSVKINEKSKEVFNAKQDDPAKPNLLRRVGHGLVGAVSLIPVLNYIPFGITLGIQHRKEEKAQALNKSESPPELPISSSPDNPVAEPSVTQKKHPLLDSYARLKGIPPGPKKEELISALKDWMRQVLEKAKLPEEKISEILQNEDHLQDFLYISDRCNNKIPSNMPGAKSQKEFAWNAAVKILGLSFYTDNPVNDHAYPISRTEDQSAVIKLLNAGFETKVS